MARASLLCRSVAARTTKRCPLRITLELFLIARQLWTQHRIIDDF